MAISMEYDTVLGAQLGFPKVPHPGFPLVLSKNPPNDQPLVAPFPGTTDPNSNNWNVAYIGISAAPSRFMPHPYDPHRVIVPVAVAGIVQATILLPREIFLQAGSPLIPANPEDFSFLHAGAWPLKPFFPSSFNAGKPVVVAQLALPLLHIDFSGGGMSEVQAYVWVIGAFNTEWYPQGLVGF
jgi:hypothetical protein